MTGARLTTDAAHGLADDGRRSASRRMCVGGGQGMAMVVERVS